MKPQLLLRIAAVLTLLFCAGHMLGRPWTPVLGPAEKSVVEAMKAQTFVVEGVVQSYWNFYYGFGLMLGVYLLLQAVLLWQLAGLAATHWRQVRHATAAFLLSFLLGAVLAWKYVVAIAAVFSLAVALCLLLALLFGKADAERVEERAAA